MSDVHHIAEYLLYLKRDCGLSVSLHVSSYESVILSGELRNFNIHDNSYCAYVKSDTEAGKYCVQCQNKVRAKCMNGAFEGVCYAGVREFVYPITGKGETVGFISVSGYKTENSDVYIKKLSEKYMLDADKLLACYSMLKPDTDLRERVDVLIRPLCDMLELAYLKSEHINDNSFLGDRILWYLRDNYTRSITSDDICSALHCSRTHMSRVFNAYTGKSIKEYLTKLRVENACQLLAHSSLSICEIAYSVGFGDSNYFSGIFKKATGCSPSEYRKMSKSR